MIFPDFRARFFLERPRITEILEEAARRPVVCIAAGAGYGKSQAVYAFVRKRQATTVWLQLSESDNNQERFWEHFTAAVKNISEGTAAKLKEMGFPDTERYFERYLSIPREDVVEADAYFFVFDDFHLLKNPKVLRFIERSVKSPFPNICSILISRQEIQLNLMILFSRGQAVRLGEEDFRFTRSETEAFFGGQGIFPEPDDMAAICRDTEGWAFALHLAALAFRREGGAASGAAADPYARYAPHAFRANIFRLIDGEIYGPSSPPLKKFLLCLSLIEELPLALLRRLDPEGGLLSELDEISSFVHFDVYTQSYRIHHLFLEFLKEKQGEVPQAERVRLWGLAARWCLDNNRKIDALLYAEKAGDYGLILEASYTVPVLIKPSAARFLLGILERAQPEVEAASPLLSVLRSRIYISLGRIADAAAYLQTLIDRLEAAVTDSSPDGDALRHRALLASYMTLGWVGLLACTFPRRYEYIACFRKAAEHAAASGHTYSPPMSVTHIGSFVCRVNTPEAAGWDRYIAALKEAAPYAARAMGGCLSGLDALAAAERAFYRDGSGEALALRAAAEARRGEQWETENRAFFLLLRIYLARGDAGALRRVWAEIRARLSDPGYLNRNIQFDILSGWLFSHLGLAARIPSWLKDDFEAPDFDAVDPTLELLVKAKFHLAEKRCAAALSVLETIETAPWGLTLALIEAKALKAVCLYKCRGNRELGIGNRESGVGNRKRISTSNINLFDSRLPSSRLPISLTPDSRKPTPDLFPSPLTPLAEAYALSRPNGFDMPFIELGKDMRALAGYALTQQTAIPVDWLLRIRRQAAGYAKKAYPQAALWAEKPSAPGLSRREMAVLSGLSCGLTREELALESRISMNTVKSVLRSIYHKLGAVNRADAIRIAMDRGLLHRGE
jgi:LuxR family maltose regulon positive regulatory protein